VRDQSGQVVNASDSMAGIQLPSLAGPFDLNRVRTDIIRDGYGTRIRVIEREITMNGKTYDFEITGSLDEVLGLVDSFRGQTLIVLGAVGVMLAVMSFIVARLALRPVGRLLHALEQVRGGERESVDGTYPREIAPLAVEVNELLRSNAQILERARNQVGNLAHGLKTPLAVLRNEAASERSNLGRTVLAESEKMLALVSTYLDRARIAARTAVVGKRADPTLVMLRLVRAMRKLHPAHEIDFRRPDASLPWFRGEEGDFEEMAGNLIDNACKWCKSRVQVSMLAERQPGTVMLMVLVEDDGPGLTDEEIGKVMRRGVRLDEHTPGSGLGLDIVKELVAIYGGSLVLARSPLGGLAAELHLPSARVGRA
jgi:signal transduction histidine kinase